MPEHSAQRSDDNLPAAPYADAAGTRRLRVVADDGPGDPADFLAAYDLEMPPIPVDHRVRLAVVRKSKVPRGWRSLGPALMPGAVAIFRVEPMVSPSPDSAASSRD